MSKVQKETENELKKEDLKTQLEEIVEKHNEAVRVRNLNDELVKRCLGAIEVLQSLIGEENAEVRKEE